jgi:hypothetical protein
MSASGTRHIVGIPPGLEAIRAHSSRITTLCGFGIRPEDALWDATRVCEFCLAEAAAIRRREAEWEQMQKGTQEEAAG